MNKMKSLALMLAACALGLISSLAAAAPAQTNRMVAVVNNDVITSGELNSRAHITALNMRRQNITLPPMEQLRAQVLQQLIFEKLVEQEARSTGIRVDDAFLNVSIERIAMQNRLTVAQLRQVLAKDGVSWPQFRDQIRGQIMAQRLREQQVDEKIEIPESEIDAFMAEQAGFNVNDQMEYHVFHIAVPITSSMTREERSNAEDKAEKLLSEARKGGDFQQLAAGMSGSSDALEGGDLGWKTLSQMPKELSQAVKAAFARRDHVSMLETANGYDIIKVPARRNGVQNKLAGGPVAQTHVRQILLTPSASLPESVVASRINEIYSRLTKNKEDFATLARLNSVDASATRGGDLGWVQAGDTAPEFEQTMNKLAIGEISKPIRTPYGYQIIQVLDRRTEAADPQRLRYHARMILRERKLSQAVQTWQRELRDKAFVEIRNDAY